MSGRPPTLKEADKLSNQVSVNLRKNDYESLSKYCKDNKISMSETIRLIIVKFLNNKTNED